MSQIRVGTAIFYLDGNQVKSRHYTGFGGSTVIATRNGSNWVLNNTNHNSVNAFQQLTGASSFGVAGRTGQFTMDGGNFVPVTDSGQPVSDALAEDFRARYDEAKQANEQRYNDILGLYDQQMSNVANYGQQTTQDIHNDYATLGGQAQQQMINSGLYGSTVAPTMQMGVQRQKSAALGRHRDNQALVKNQITGARANFMERRVDTYPDLQLYASTMQNLGRYGGSSAANLFLPTAGYGG